MLFFTQSLIVILISFKCRSLNTFNLVFDQSLRNCGSLLLTTFIIITCPVQATAQLIYKRSRIALKVEALFKFFLTPQFFHEMQICEHSSLHVTWSAIYLSNNFPYSQPFLGQYILILRLVCCSLCAQCFIFSTPSVTHRMRTGWCEHRLVCCSRAVLVVT